jgi:hypothetical protein
LEFALTNWKSAILGDDKHQDKPRVEPIGKGVTSCKLEYEGIIIEGSFRSEERILILRTQGLPEIIVRQVRGETSWKGDIHFDPFGQVVVMNSKKTELFSQVLALAARLNLGINEFMDDPEGFLGIESTKSRQHARQRVKQRLLEINRNHYERRKTEAVSRPVTRRLNDEIDATPDSDELKLKEPRKSPKTAIKSGKRKTDRKREAEEWLKNNPEFSEDVDAQIGITSIHT